MHIIVNISPYFSYNWIYFDHTHRDRLTASDMIHVKKVMEHVYEKIVLSDNSSNSSSGGADKMPPDELSALADAKVEIHCNDMVRLSFFFFYKFHHLSISLTHGPRVSKDNG